MGDRTRKSEEAFAHVRAVRDELAKSGMTVPRVVAGGTPTFPLHSQRQDVECSPGTSVFWDWGYSATLPDLDFLPAVLLLTRVISKPGTNLLCLDLGHKAVASENPPPRVQLLELPDARHVGHSEEHLVLETDRAGEFAVGSTLLRYAVAHLPDRRAAQRRGGGAQRPRRRTMAGGGKGAVDHDLRVRSLTGFYGSRVDPEP